MPHGLLSTWICPSQTQHNCNSTGAHCSRLGELCWEGGQERFRCHIAFSYWREKSLRVWCWVVVCCYLSHIVEGQPSQMLPPRGQDLGVQVYSLVMETPPWLVLVSLEVDSIW